MQLSSQNFSSQLAHVNQSAPKASAARLEQLRSLAQSADNSEIDKDPRLGAVDVADLGSSSRLRSENQKLSLSSEKVVSQGWLKTVKETHSEVYSGDKNVVVAQSEGKETSWSIFGWTFASSSETDTKMGGFLMA